MSFIMELNLHLGLNDIVFYGFFSLFGDALLLSFLNLPAMALFAKVTPKHIEGTGFALLTGTINLADSVIMPLMGSLYNDLFVGLTNENIDKSKMSTLIWI